MMMSAALVATCKVPTLLYAFNSRHASADGCDARHRNMLCDSGSCNIMTVLNDAERAL
jgi:hypothetical protein